MLKVRRIGTFSALASVLLIGSLALPASASHLSFGAKLTPSTQPNGPEACSDNVDSSPSGAVCSWVARVAFENGSHYTAPANGTLTRLKLVSCTPGKFTLQLVKLNSHGHAKAVRNGPVIRYKGDARNASGDCGGPDGVDYIIQVFKINLRVDKGEYIAVKAASVGTLHCSGDNMDLYYPPLATGTTYRSRSGGTGCALLVSLQYG